MKGLKGINLLFGEISPEELKKIQGSTEGFAEQIQRYQRRPLEEKRTEDKKQCLLGTF